MADIIGHPWMQGDMATAEEVREEFARREVEVKAALNQQMEEERAKKQAARVQGARRGDQRGRYMGANVDNEEETKEEEVDLKLPLYNFNAELLKTKHTKFFTTANPNTIFLNLQQKMKDE